MADASRFSKVYLSLFVVVFASIGVFFLWPTSALTTNSNTSSPNVLLWGTNLSMDNSQDQFLINSGAATTLQSLHAQLIRMPLRPNLTLNDYTVALNKIKQIGATPIIVVHGETFGSDPYPPDAPVLQLAKSIFPTQTVYVDFGNEEDLAGASNCSTSNCSYVTGQYGWNNELPKFKAITGANFKYGGPVNFQYNESYADAFAQIANPKPDFIVWHAYAGSCGHNTGTGQPDSQAHMFTSITNWGQHIQQIAGDFNGLKDVNGNSLAGEPIIIDEWNYASDLGVAGSATPCYSKDQQFITTFFTNAMTTFVNSQQYGLIGTAEYEAYVGQDESMIDGSNSPTFQGQTFASTYNFYFNGSGGGGGVVPPPTVSLSANPTSVISGGTSTLTWNSTNATSCTASGSWSGAKPVSGTTVTAALSANASYTLDCIGSGGNTSAVAIVSVNNPPPLPVPTLSMNANPLSVNSGQTSTLTWNSANATSCTASGSWSGSKPTGGTITLGPLTSGTTYNMICSGSGGSASASVSVTINNIPATPPSTPTGLMSTNTASNSVSLTWVAANPGSNGITGYYVVRNGTTIGQTQSPSYVDTSVQPGQTYTYQVMAYDKSSSTSGLSNSVTVMTPKVPAPTIPTAPSNLAAQAISSSQINLNWTPSTSNAGVTGYFVYRGGNKIATVSSTSFGDTGLSAGSPYVYSVMAYNAAGSSSQSNSVTATTQSTSPQVGSLGAISGQVTTSGKPLIYVAVSVVYGGHVHYTNTNSQGKYRLNSIPVTRQTSVYFAKKYYKTAKATISLKANQTTILNATLKLGE